MKKIILLILLVLLCGCKSKYIVCDINIKNDNLNYELIGKYKIYYRKSNVEKIEKQENYYTTERDTLKYLKNTKEIELSSLNSNYGGYEYNIKSDRKSITINTKIDVNKIDINKMVDDEYLDKYYVNKNRLTLGGIKLFYESNGAECK